jgi:hypothetical protein
MKLEIRSQKPEAGGQRSEIRDQKSDGRNQKPGGFRILTSDVCLLASGLCLLAGCATEPKPVPPTPPMIAPQTAPAPAAPAEAKRPEPAPPPKPPPSPPSVPPASVSTAPQAKDEFVIAIDSQPAGAIVVVNNIPIGKAPQRLKVKAASQGFFRDYVTVKVRFLATSAAETSQTVEEDFTPLQKIPAGLLFTPAGAQRRDK